MHIVKSDYYQACRTNKNISCIQIRFIFAMTKLSLG